MSAERTARVTDLFDGLGPRSRASVATALRVQQTPHVGGTLVIQVSEDPAKPCEIAFMTGPVTVSVDTWKMASTK